MLNYRNYLITATLAFIGAILFQFLHIPMPWLLGPLFITMIFRLTTPIPIAWHKQLKNLGLVLAGYSIGVSFTVQAFSDIGRFLPLMIGINIFYITVFLLLSRFIVWRTNVDQLAALTSTVPGGMTQILAYAAEKRSKHLTMITFYQVLRVLCILSFVPLIVTTGVTPTTVVHDEKYSFTLIVFIIIAFIAGAIGNKLRIPTGYMLGPVILFIILQLTNVSIPHLPSSALHIAQLCIGVFIGMLLQKKDLHLSKKVIFYGFTASSVYIGSAYILTFFIVDHFSIDFKTAFLSIIPGGLDQMGLIATSVKADVTIVTAFQLFRILIISVFIVPGLKYFTKTITVKKEKSN